MIRDYVWGKWVGDWILLRREVENHIDIYYDLFGEVYDPEYVALFKLKSGMKWRHRQSKTIIKITGCREHGLDS